MKIFVDLVEEAGGREPRLIRADEERQILGHEAAFNGVHADLFQRFGELLQIGIVVELGAMRQTAGPCEDRSDGVGRGFLALLMLAIVAGYGAVGGFRFHRLAIRRHQNRGHQAERAEALRDDIRLHVAIIVLTGPDIAARPLERRGDHVVDEAVFVPDLLFFKLRLEFGVEDFLEDVLEAAIIGLEDGVLRGEIDRIAALQAVIEGSACEFADRFVQIIHGHGHASRRGLIDFMFDGLAIFTDELDRQCALAGELEVSRAVLVAESMAADDDRLGPARHEARHVLADDRLAEDHAAEDIADGAVGRLPHFLQLEFFHARFVGRDGRAFYAHAIFLDGIGCIDRDLIIGRIAVLDRKIVVFQVDVEIGMDKLVLDELPDNAGHLVAVELDDRVCNLDFCHG
ncbi:NADP-dependent isocitrate dehydrogenase [Brucella melitensis bv. 3 str. Ether]|uniref:NADP-dependent isocitrate dehydrogenase n=1 Tax=Brucella neotomae 5K33 TaxID=520456 RepID=A0A7U8PXX2_BRUNE|nr:NADP-dependent isocitrate dehydrogenase [Brucella neotomae 5K33]EEZ12016.1 NADP-dependent isocitrate dehydrogenase [Brucella melitensis bv. 3 str. Ether]EEZ17876.1 NADP-dependent isocitrate dehydrogenase [Brucella melitensis bv. 2 str. 63/9]